MVEEEEEEEEGLLLQCLFVFNDSVESGTQKNPGCRHSAEWGAADEPVPNELSFSLCHYLSIY